MNILVTGSSGYIAANLIPMLNLAGHNVVSYDIIEGRDILDKDKLVSYMEYCDVVIHLAAIVGIMDCEKDPQAAIKTNLIGTKNVVDIAESYNIPVIYASTFAAKAPFNVYGLTKRLSEYLVLNKNGVVLRMANIYGGEKYLTKGSVVCSFIKKKRRNEVAEIHGDGSQLRDFIHVKDVCRAYIDALEAPSGIYEVSTNTFTTILELADKMGVKYMMVSPRPDTPETSNTHVPNWKPTITLEEGLREFEQ